MLFQLAKSIWNKQLNSTRGAVVGLCYQLAFTYMLWCMHYVGLCRLIPSLNSLCMLSSWSFLQKLLAGNVRIGLPIAMGENLNA